VSILTAPLLFATGHGGVFAAALHVATGVCGLDFSHLCISVLRELR
jgi:hypothetical protein